MAKFLNLDGFAKNERTITLGGATYEVVDMTVENFIETNKAALALKGSTNLAEQVDATCEMIERYIPDCPKEALRALKLEQLGAIVAFVQGDLIVDDDGNPVPPEEKVEPEKGEGAKAKKSSR